MPKRPVGAASQWAPGKLQPERREVVEAKPVPIRVCRKKFQKGCKPQESARGRAEKCIAAPSKQSK